MALDGIPVSPATPGGADVGVDLIAGKAVEVIKILKGPLHTDGGLVDKGNGFPVDVEPLTLWKSGQVNVDAAAVHIDTAPIANRKSISVRAMATNTDYVYLGIDNAVTTLTGYQLSPGESLELEVTAASEVWGISGSAGQRVCFAEIA